MVTSEKRRFSRRSASAKTLLMKYFRENLGGIYPNSTGVSIVIPAANGIGISISECRSRISSLRFDIRKWKSLALLSGRAGGNGKSIRVRRLVSDTLSFLVDESQRLLEQ